MPDDPNTRAVAPPAGMADYAPPPDGEVTATGVRYTPEAVQLAILQEQREIRRMLERGTWLQYAQEIGRSTLPGGLRVDQVLILGAATTAGVLGGGGAWLTNLFVPRLP